MLNKIKLKNTYFCNFVLIFPMIILPLIAFSAPLLLGSNAISVGLFFIFAIATLVYIFANLNFLIYSDAIIECLRAWQKHRTAYSTDMNGNTCDEIAENLRARLSKWKDISSCADSESFLQKYKIEKKFISYHDRIRHDFVIYQFDNLTPEKYNEKLNLAVEAANPQAKNERDAVSSVVVFLCNKVDIEVMNILKEPKEDPCEFNVSVMPLIYNASCQLYYFDSMEAYNMIIKNPINYTIKDINNIVFGGKTPIENNNNFDYSSEYAKWNEKTLQDVYEEFKAEKQKEKQTAQNMFNQLSNGKAAYIDDNLYLKYNDKLAVFLTFQEDENKAFAILDSNWTYPRKNAISKNELEILKNIAIKHFASLNLELFFDDEE